MQVSVFHGPLRLVNGLIGKLQSTGMNLTDFPTNQDLADYRPRFPFAKSLCLRNWVSFNLRFSQSHKKP